MPIPVHLHDLGLVPYKQTWDYQQQLVDELIRTKQNLQTHHPELLKQQQQHHFILCEHPHVYTLGKSGKDEHLLLSHDELDQQHIAYYHINRGGDITYHGPGQLVGYPIFDLDCFFTDIGKFVRTVEEAAIRTVAEYGIEAQRIEGQSGVWIPATEQLPPRKICAIGIHLSRWITMHGFALNVNTDLQYFRNIIPCGITDKGVTSIQQELGAPVSISDVKHKIRQHYQTLFDITLQ